MSLWSVLNHGRSGLLAAQRAVEVTANNVANAQTEGYSRQRVELAANKPVRFANGEFGGGVRILGTTRARSEFLDAAYRRAAADAAGGNLRAGVLSRMEAILGEPGETGIGAALDAFHSAWGDLASRPTVGSVQAAVQQAGVKLATQLNRAAEQLDALAAENRARLGSAIDEVNALAQSVADLNREIVAQESAGQSANTLRDTRDRTLDRLAQLTGAETIERQDGSTAVLLGGLMLVDGAETRPLAATLIGGVTEVTRASLTTTPVAIGGELGALRQSSVIDIPDLMGDLDALARGLVESVNALHRQGVTWSGTPPVSAAAGDFFAADPLLAATADPLRTARGIRLDSAIAASPTAIAASISTATGPGDATIALQISGLRTTAVSFIDAAGNPVATEPAGDFLRRLASNVAFAVRRVTDRAEVDNSMAWQADTRRQEVSGVSVDEELVRLIKFQQSYAAAARLISAADEMAQTVLDLRR